MIQARNEVPLAKMRLVHIKNQKAKMRLARMKVALNAKKQQAHTEAQATMMTRAKLSSPIDLQHLRIEMETVTGIPLLQTPTHLEKSPKSQASLTTKNHQLNRIRLLAKKSPKSDRFCLPLIKKIESQDTHLL